MELKHLFILKTIATFIIQNTLHVDTKANKASLLYVVYEKIEAIINLNSLRVISLATME
jgi:hypothetical protein